MIRPLAEDNVGGSDDLPAYDDRFAYPETTFRVDLQESLASSSLTTAPPTPNTHRRTEMMAVPLQDNQTVQYGQGQLVVPPVITTVPDLLTDEMIKFVLTRKLRDSWWGLTDTSAVQKSEVSRVLPYSCLYVVVESLVEERNLEEKVQPNSKRHTDWDPRIRASNNERPPGIMTQSLWNGRVNFNGSDFQQTEDTNALWDSTGHEAAAGWTTGEHRKDIPETLITSICGTCAGAGSKPCAGCRTTGRTSCLSCKGTGAQTESSKDSTKTEPCSNCRGSGRARCQECGGIGRKDCSTCDGHGSVTSHLVIKSRRAVDSAKGIVLLKETAPPGGSNHVSTHVCSVSIPKFPRALVDGYESKRILFQDAVSNGFRLRPPHLLFAEAGSGVQADLSDLAETIRRCISEHRGRARDEDGRWPSESDARLVSQRMSIFGLDVYEVVCTSQRESHIGYICGQGKLEAFEGHIELPGQAMAVVRGIAGAVGSGIWSLGGAVSSLFGAGRQPSQSDSSSSWSEVSATSAEEKGQGPPGWDDLKRLPS
ncbi:uncharacterized protein BJ171DRAFT_202292 [Polychytrium aggregatum]|uniref:uncharacterized protein n=1 Tax=Polychytrium aggregatum TaxID=110093 RepID=UPI0022FE8A10|nr:uncharacterized protein BJ171DRAFT_202292 [Polychytrium aggregatum]KAI9199758.1 hypothetical protein BJ171DRAFT_202292 [Polychytrium aggregatum]